METEKRVILEKNGDYYRVIGAVFKKNSKELIKAHEIVESQLLSRALKQFYQLNPDWTNVYVQDNIEGA